MNAALALQAFRQFVQRQIGLFGQPFAQALARLLINARWGTARRLDGQWHARAATALPRTTG